MTGALNFDNLTMQDLIRCHEFALRKKQVNRRACRKYYHSHVEVVTARRLAKKQRAKELVSQSDLVPAVADQPPLGETSA